MLKKIVATVCYPIHIEQEFDIREDYDNDNEEHCSEIEELVLKEADKIFNSSSIKPTIHELFVDDEELI